MGDPITDIVTETPNPTAEPVLAKWHEYKKVDSPVQELANAGVTYDQLSEGQRKQLGEDFAHQASHRPWDIKSFLERDQFLPDQAVQKGLGDALVDAGLNAPGLFDFQTSKNTDHYGFDYHNTLSQIRWTIPRLSAETRNNAASTIVSKICEAVIGEQTAVAGKGHRHSGDIPAVVTALVDRGDTTTLGSIKSIVENTMTILESRGKDPKWEASHADWVREKVIPVIESWMIPVESEQ